MNKFRLFFYLLLPALLYSCVADEMHNKVDIVTDKGVEVYVSLQMPAASILTTRAISEIDENYIEDINVLAFKADNTKDSGWAFAYSAVGTSISDVEEDNAKKAKKQFTVKLMKDSEQQTLVILANVNSQLEALGEIAEGTDKDELLAQLVYSNNGKWNANNDAAEDDASKTFTAFPMWGEVKETINDRITEISGVSLVRGVARFDLLLSQDIIDADNFTLNEVYVYNSKNQGRIVPDTDNLLNTAKVKAATVPAGNINNASPLVYTVPTSMKTAFVRTIYLFEATGKQETEASAATCVVVGGTYGTDSQPTYYRLDFLKKETTDSYYRDLLRNHLYRMNILKVLGSGYSTPEEAFNSKSFNIVAEVVEWDNGQAGDVIFDGQYHLSICPKMVFNFSKSADMETVNVKTDVPAGFQITKITEANGTVNNGWLSTNKTINTFYGAGGTETAISIVVSENKTGEVRTGYIYIKAARLEAKLTVTQSKRDVVFSFIEYINDNGTGLNIPHTGCKIGAKVHTNTDWGLSTNIKGVEASMAEPALDTAADYTLEVTIPANTTWEPIDRKLWVLYKGIAFQETLFTQAAAPGIRTVNANNQEITELIFVSPVGVAPNKQTLTVNWSPKDADLAVTTTKVGNTAFPTNAGAPTSGTITGGNKGTGTISYPIQPVAFTAAEQNNNPFLEKVSKVEFAVDNVKTSILLRQLCYNLVTDVKNEYMLNGQEETLTVQANFAWKIASVIDNDNILQNKNSLIGLTSRNGNKIKLSMAAATKDKSKDGKKATITFTNTEDKNSTYRIVITAVEVLYVGRFGGALVNKGGVWQFEKELVVQSTHESRGIIWGGNQTLSGVTTDVNNGKGNTYNLHKKSATAFPAANLCFMKNANYDNITSVNNVNYKWFLPAQKQLMSIWVVHNSFGTNEFGHGDVWTSTEGGGRPDIACYVDFSDGGTAYSTKDYPRSVRCVREL
ncbi:BACON domain-containing protein [Bacteroides sp. 519]|uniref:BACON domain-containing protein n=1 Tax=Bacteroides sp. 519 TaxID=2302937 RepID=UPI0013D780D1|nr:BACON domain-containing carbohydrate-binding protein [Bacteroides sp. 519]NDV56914.1 hypothetical protein [Bacteroides sp. 519]